MTNEEQDKAIRILQWLHNNNFLFRSTEEDVKFATEYAIKVLEQEPVLDKIRAEIEQVAEEESKIDKKWAQGLKYTLKIIDKYKAESEDKERHD